MIGTYATIVGVGGEFPRRSVSNAELAGMLGPTVMTEELERDTGVRTRYWMGERELPSGLATAAAEKALMMSGADPENPAANLISLHLATITPDSPSPNMACIVQGNLRAPHTCVPVPLNLDCAGSVMGLRLSSQELDSTFRSPNDTALVVGVNALSRFLNTADPATAALFGDGAGAFALQIRQGAFRPEFAILSQHRPTAMRIMQDSLTPHPYTEVDSRAARRPIIDIMTQSAQRVANAATLFDPVKGINWEGVDYFIPHQTNIHLIEAVAGKLKVPKDKMIVTVGEHGNTSSATLPLALWEASQQGRFEPDKRYRLLMTAAGAGIVGGAVLIDLILPR